MTLCPSKNSQLITPLFEFSGACSGCGETPYIKLATQLFGDRMIVANATGCSSIYGGNLPTTPWTFNREGPGPAWSNSLFEDNAEFGLGMRMTLDKQQEYASELLGQTLYFHHPVVIGDTITATVTVTAKEADLHRIRFDCQCINQRGEVVISSSAEVVAPTTKVKRPSKL